MNRNVKSLLYSSNMWYFGEGMLGPLLAVYTEHIGGDVLDVSWAWATYLIVMGIATIIVGKIASNTKSTEFLMISGYVMNMIFTFGYLLVQTPIHLFIVQAGLGISAALATPTWDTLYSRFADKNIDSMEWGFAEGEASIITGLAILVGGSIVGYYSFQALFIIMGIIQTISVFYLVKTYKRNQHRTI